MEETTLITIVFAIPETITKKISELSAVLAAKYPTRETKNSSAAPHITIYQAKFPKENKEKLFEIINNIAKNNGPVSCVPNGSNVKSYYVGIGFEKTNQIEHLHRIVVEQLNPLRKGLLKSAYVEKRGEFNLEEQFNIDTWGYPHVMNLYKPHLTLIALADEEDVQKVANEIAWQEAFESSELEVVIMSGDEKIIHKIKLGL